MYIGVKISTLKRKKQKFEDIMVHVNNQTSKQKGVCFTGGKYFSYINIDKRRIPLGSYLIEEDAIFARKTAEKIYNILSQLNIS